MGKTKPEQFYKAISTNWSMGPESSTDFSTSYSSTFQNPGIVFVTPKVASKGDEVFIKQSSTDQYITESKRNYTPERSVLNSSYSKTTPVRDPKKVNKTNYELGNKKGEFITSSMSQMTDPSTRPCVAHPNYKEREDLGHFTKARTGPRSTFDRYMIDTYGLTSKLIL
jgi:hypothetical protein